MLYHNKKNRKILLFSYLLIAVTTLTAYYPSLTHMPRSDHFIYLANTANQHDLFSLTVKNYALNRIDLPYGIKDELLFRPVLYIFLGLERWLFGLNFTYWQATGILLHLTVLWFLLKFLYETYKSFWAFLLTLYFAVLFAGSEMVVWSHINGYMIFIICILTALSQIQRLIKEKQIRIKNLICITGPLTFAAFTHELGAMFCLFFALYFYLSFHPRKSNSLKLQNKQNMFLTKKTAIISFCLPALLYCFLSFLDFHFRNLELSVQRSPIVSIRYTIDVIWNTLSSLFWWLHSGLFPSRVFTEIGQRTFMYPLYIDFSGKPPLSFLTVIQVSMSIGLIFTYLVIVRIHITKAFIKQRRGILCLLFCLFGSFAFVISLGRISVRGLERILVENPYYHYLFWIFFIIFIYNLIPFDRLKNTPRSTLQTACTALFIMLIVFNYYFTFTLIFERTSREKFHRVLSNDIRALIKQHGKQKDFSFSLDPAIDKAYYSLDWAKRSDDPPDKDYNYLKLLYPKYYTDIEPKYVYTLDKNDNWKFQELIIKKTF